MFCQCGIMYVTKWFNKKNNNHNGKIHGHNSVSLNQYHYCSYEFIFILNILLYLCTFSDRPGFIYYFLITQDYNTLPIALHLHLHLLPIRPLKPWAQTHNCDIMLLI